MLTACSGCSRLSEGGGRHPGSLVLLALVSAIGIVLLLIGFGISLVFEDRAFDAAGWKCAGADDSGARREMVDDLVDSRVLDGRTREQVEALLGPGAADWEEEREIRYGLGSQGGPFPVDGLWLVIRFGQGGRVAEYLVVPD